jgi:hypothetical protein
MKFESGVTVGEIGDARTDTSAPFARLLTARIDASTMTNASPLFSRASDRRNLTSR